MYNTKDGHSESHLSGIKDVKVTPEKFQIFKPELRHAITYQLIIDYRADYLTVSHRDQSSTGLVVSILKWYFDSLCC